VLPVEDAIHAMLMLIGRAAISWSHPQTLGFKYYCVIVEKK